MFRLKVRKHPHQEFIQVDTTNILFIVGGALMIRQDRKRVGKKSMGFGAEVTSKKDIKLQTQTPQPEDSSSGLIPT